MDRRSDSESATDEAHIGLDTKRREAFYAPATKSFLMRLYVGAVVVILLVAGGVYWISQRETGPRREQGGGTGAAEEEAEMATKAGELALAEALHHERWRDAVEILEGWRREGRAEAKHLRLQVELALRLGRVDLARAAWEALAQKDRLDPTVPALEGLVLVAEGQAADARRLAGQLRWSELSGAQAELVGRAWIAVLADRDLAAGDFNAVLDLIPADLAIRLPFLFDRRQAALLSLGWTEEASSLLRRAAHRLDRPRLLLAEGDIERVAGNQAAAESLWREALGGVGEMPDLAIALAVAERAASSGAAGLLVDVLERILQAGAVRGSPRLWEMGIAAAAGEDRLTTAVRIARAVEQARPNDPAWLNNRVWAETLAGQPRAGSLDALAATSARYPGVPEFAVTEALAAWREGDLGRAAAALARAEHARAQVGRPPSPTEQLVRVLVARASGDAEGAARLREQLEWERLVPGEQRLLGD